jgi:hypothetical protein
VAPATEAELAPIRRRVAADAAARWSGASGRARRCAAVAAGELAWRPTAELEMAILGVDGAGVAAALAESIEFSPLMTAGAGLMPIPETGGAE